MIDGWREVVVNVREGEPIDLPTYTLISRDSATARVMVPNSDVPPSGMSWHDHLQARYGKEYNP